MTELIALFSKSEFCIIIAVSPSAISCTSWGHQGAVNTDIEMAVAVFMDGTNPIYESAKLQKTNIFR